MSYYKTIMDAETLEAEGKNDAAYIKYLNAINDAYPFPHDVLSTIRCCLKSNYKNEAHGLVETLILCGFKTESSRTAIAEIIGVSEMPDEFPFVELKM